LRARFDGEVFHPVEPLPIAPDTIVLLTVETAEKPESQAELPPVDLDDGSPPVMGEPYCFLKYAMSLNLDGPPDWSENLDDYLYHGKKFPSEP
ncbi:MAG: hypothetical protein ACJ75H_25085, partial [Thermoanaerobaculia bacterium]